MTAKPLVADTACFDLLTFLDEDERGALEFVGLIRIYIKSQTGFLQLGFFNLHSIHRECRTKINCIVAFNRGHDLRRDGDPVSQALLTCTQLK